MSAEAVVALVSVVVVLQVAVAGFMWRNLVNQISAGRTDLEKQIADSAARAEQGQARIESNLRDTENRLMARIDKQTERIDAVHRDLRGLGERIARVEAGQGAEQVVATGSYAP